MLRRVRRHPSLDDRHDPAIRLVEHDATWAARARDELARISAALGQLAVRVDHVGSTAVPGLAAKPIVDLQASVAAITPVDAYVAPLERLGYLFVPDPASPEFHFFAKPPERPRAFHLHVCEAGSRDERRHLAVRDYLRAHPDAAGEYDAFKRALVAAAPGDRLAYIAGKEPFMRALEERALRWAGAQM
jgi:GrpB-like predicted nucleotidyltransferase (UPF0157 family)